MPQTNLPILVVEDSPEDYEAMVRAFTKAAVPNPVYRFSYGEDALDFLRQRGPYAKHGPESRPGLLVLDLNLPGTEGIKVLTKVRSDPALRAIPVIVFSTSANPREVEACYAAGANCYIVKPPDPEEFIAAVRRIKEFWLETATLPAHTDPLPVIVPGPISPAPATGPAPKHT